MLIRDSFTIKAQNKNAKFYGCAIGETITVDVYDLPKNSNMVVDCSCDECKTIFKRSLQLLNRSESHLCYECAIDKKNKTKNTANISKANSIRVGALHPRYNANKPAFDEYKSKVYAITRKQPIEVLEHSDKLRGMCGVDGAYQLDHITSVKFGFDNNIPAETIGSIGNLQFLPWEHNRTKWM
jgi:hypothetical protein